jgi:tetratricopeptide (TPR) repeat protein
MYLGQTRLGIALLFTFGFCGVWQVFDLLLLPDAVKQANQHLRDSEKVLPTNRLAKEAFAYHRDGMSTQANDKYAEALKNYKDALARDDPNGRAEMLYYRALMFFSKGDLAQAIDFYSRSLEYNYNMLPKDLNNFAESAYHLGSIAEERGDADEADRRFDQAADFWVKAIRLDPNNYNYLKAQNWLKTSGRGSVEVVMNSIQRPSLSESESATPITPLAPSSISRPPSNPSTLTSSAEEDELDELLRRAKNSINRTENLNAGGES